MDSDKDRVELMDEVGSLRQQVQDADRQMSDLFEVMGDSIFIIDPLTMQILEANKNAARRLGYTQDELVKMNLEDIEKKLTPETGGGGTAWESTFSRTSFYECMHIHQDGSATPVEVSSRLVKRGGKGVLLNAVRDISRRKHMDAEREQLITELDAYAHTVAHDLKNPVAIILGYSDILREDLSDLPPEDLSKYLGIIHQTAVKMHTIIDELLLLAGVRSKAEVEIDRLDMGNIAQEALNRQANRVAERGAEIIVPDVWPEAVGYAPWVEEVWANYISNAIKYGGDPPRVELGASADGDPGQATFWVRDNGQGISPEEQVRLFGQFTRLDVARAEGHGLGLSIVQRIVERLGGTVSVDSTLGTGSTFIFTLPQP